MKTMKTTLFLALVLAVAVSASPATAQADFSKFVAVGASVDMGVLDGCIVKYGQIDSWNAIFARQAKAPAFEQPLLDTPGTGCMYLISLAPQFGTRPAAIKPLNLTLPRPYDNMSISGYTTSDAVNKKSGSSPTDIAGLILRNLNATQIEQAASLKPTFVAIGVYGNDVLGAVLNGTAIDNVTVVPKALYSANYQKIVDTFKASQGGTGKGVAHNIPDVTSIAFATTVPPYITSGGKVVVGPDGKPMTFLSSKGGNLITPGAQMAPIPADSLLTLPAASFLATGYGIPCAVLDAGGAPANDPRRANCNKPLPDSATPQLGLPGVVLYPDELSLLKSRTAEFNAEIQRIATAAGYKVFDSAALFADLKTHGREYAGITVNTAFLSGGITSYDGFHLTSLGYAIWADEMVQFVNANYGTSIPRVDMSTYLFNGNSSPGGYPVGAAGTTLSVEETIEWAAEIFTPENTQRFLSMFPVSFRSSMAAPAPEELPVPAEPRSGRVKLID